MSDIQSILATKSKLVQWDDDFDCYKWTAPRKLLGGITKVLKERFYSYAVRPQALKLPKNKLRSDGKQWKKGRKGGTLVHEQLEDFVEYAKNGKKLADLDPRVARILQEVLNRSWTIYDAEYCVGDTELGRATGVDLLCLANGRPAVIEIKTGFDSVLYEGPTHQRMKRPFNMLDTSPWAQHQMQLLTTVALFEKMTGLSVLHAEVWVLGVPNAEKECRFRPFPLHPELIKLMPNVLRLITPKTTKVEKRKYYVASKKPAKKPYKKT